MRAAAIVTQLVIVFGVPFLVAVQLRKRWPRLSWELFAVGAVTFILSQVVHIPLNSYLLVPMLRSSASLRDSLIAGAILLGLSAGLCEELSRYAVLRWWRRDDRSGPQGLMFGAGHGGIESIIVGLMVLAAAYNVAYLERVGVENLDLASEAQDLVRRQLAQYRSAPAYGHLLGAVERLFTMVFHITASMLVMVSVALRRPLFLLAAIGAHAGYDAGALWVAHRLGPVASEVALALTMVPNLMITRACARLLPGLEALQPDRPAKKSGEPLELIAAHKSFKHVRALDDVSFTIRRGERACLLGPNGAGKTTAIRLATGAFSPTSGYALLFGVGLNEPEFLDAKRRTGIVPQQPGMYEEMTVRQHLELMRKLYRVESYDEIAKRLGLDEYMDRPTSKLSGGWQRRLCLASALLSHPELLILDEPSAGLDPVAAREMMDLLQEVSRDRTTLLCTHDLDEAEELCDSVVILRHGHVLLHEPIEQLKAKAPAVIALRAAEGPERLRQALSEHGHSGEIVASEVRLTSVEGERMVPELLRLLLDAGLRIYECRIIRPTLEELFLQLVQAPSRRPAELAASGEAS
jgi:ABC-2 type transport system ATP-binding protein